MLLILTTTLPMGANVYLVAARYETYVARASTAVLFSTTISVVTVSLLAVLLAKNNNRWLEKILI